MTEPMRLTDDELDELIHKLTTSLSVVFDTEPLEVF